MGRKWSNLLQLVLGRILIAFASDVIHLNYDNFEEKTKALTGEGGIWFVEFYGNDCEPCKELDPIWEEIGTELKGVVNVAKVNAQDESNRALTHRFNVGMLPTMYLIEKGNIHVTKGPLPKSFLLQFARGGYANNPPHLSGRVPSVVFPEDLPAKIDYSPELSGPSDVVILTDDNFEYLTQATSGSTTGDWLIEFYAPWCGHCKVLHPVWEELASELKEELNVAKIDIIENKRVADRFQIKSYPTIKLLKRGEMTTFHYSGTRDKEGVKDFIRKSFSNELSAEPIPKDFTSLEIMQRWLNKQIGFGFKRYELAKRDISKGRYWTPNTVVIIVSVISGLGVVIFCVVLTKSGSRKGVPSIKKTN